MKTEIEIPKRFCPNHGIEMRPGKPEIRYDRITGAVKNVWVYWKCPKWFCFGRVGDFVVWHGEVKWPAP